MAANFNFSLGFNIEKDGINKAKQELAALKTEIQNNPTKFNLDTTSVNEAMQQLSVFEGSLKKAFNQNLGKLDTKEFMNQMHAAGYSLEGLKKSFASLGVDANSSIKSIEKGMQSANLSLKKTNETIDAMAETFKNTLKWNLASQAIHGIEGSVARAIGFVKDLDNSLNNIRIVTGKGKDEMSVFAQQANEAAKALGKTTTEYTNASLIFYQQGKSASEVRELTNATLIGANITGQSVEETSQLLTAALNGYNLEANKAMEITDKFAAVGATTGSDFNELAIGFSKVASMAKIAGVNVDQLNGMLATISTVTREAPESIGTSLKTIFGRMTELQAGKKDESGWEMGDVQKSLVKAGFTMLDQNGKLKETGSLLEEIGGKWTKLNKETQLALSTAMAGSRQQNRLIALFNNWEMYQQAVKDSQDAQGTAYEQNIVRMDSIDAKAKRLRASLESVWMQMINSDEMKSVLDFLTSMTNGVHDFIGALNGIGPVIAIIGSSLIRIFSNKASTFGVETIQGFKDSIDARKRDKEILSLDPKTETETEKKTQLERLQQQYNIRKHLTQEEHKEYIEIKNAVEAEESKLKLMVKEQEAAKKVLDTKYKSDMSKMSTSFKTNKDVMKDSEKALQELQLLKEKKMAIDEISESTLELEQLDKVALRDLQEEDGALDKIIQSIYRDVEARKLQNEQIKANQKLLSETHTAEIAAQSTALKELEDNKTRGVARMETLDEKASKVGRTQDVINGVMALSVGIGSVVSSVEAYKKAGDDIEQKSNAMATAVAGVGAALMMTGNPYIMAAGLALDLGAAIGKLYFENSGLRQVMSDNKKMLEDTTKSITDARTALGNLNKETEDYQKLQKLMDNGKVNKADLNTDQLAQYNELANKMAEVAPELVKYYDEEGNAVLDLTKSIKDLKDAQREQMRQASEAKALNVDNFAAEYANKIDTAMSKINENKQIVDIIRQGGQALQDFNGEKGTNYSTKDIAKLTAEMEKQQATLQDIGQDIQNNIVNPVFEGSKAYAKLNSQQQESVRNLFTAAQATDMAHDPKKLKEYAKAVEQTINTLGEQESYQNKLKDAEDGLMLAKKEHNKEDIATFSKEVEAYKEQLGSIKTVQETFMKMSDTKKQLTLESISNLGLEGEAYDKALAKMSQFYSGNQAFKNGPMSVKQYSDLTGVPFAGATNEGQMGQQDLDSKKQALDSARKKQQTDAGHGYEHVTEGVISNITGSVADITNLDANLSDSTEGMNTLKKGAQELSEAFKEERTNVKDLQDSYISAGLDTVATEQAQEQLNKKYWDQIAVLTKTTEGYNDLVDVYNSTSKTLDNMKQATTDATSMSQGQMNDVAASLEKYRDMYPGLSKALDDYSAHGQSAFGELTQYIGQAQQDISQNQGQMYATMHGDDAEYYQGLLDKNQSSFQQIWEMYGINAYNYKTYADYEQALEAQKSKGKLDINVQEANKNIDIHQQAEDAKKGLAEQGLQTQLLAGNKTVSIWDIANNKTLDSHEKTILALKKLWDGFTDILAGVGNILIGIYNGAVELVEDGIKGILSPINGALTLLGKQTIDVNFNGAKTDYTFKGSHSAEDYVSQLANKYNETPISMDWNLGKTPPVKKPVITPGKIGGETTPGVGGSEINPNAGEKKTPTERKIEDMKFDPKDYLLHDTNNELQQQDALIKKLAEDETKLFGKDKLDNINQQIGALNDKNKILQSQIGIMDDYEKSQQDILRNNKVGDDADSGVKFNADGTIANYAEAAKKHVDYANSLKDADAKEKAVNDAKAFIDSMKDYESYTLKTKIDTQQAIDEVNKTIHNLDVQKFEFTVKAQIDTADMQEQVSKFQDSLLSDEFQDIPQKIQDTVDQLTIEEQKINDIKAHINEIQSDTNLTEQEKYDMTKDYSNQLMTAVSNVQQLREQWKKLDSESITAGLDLFNQQLEKFNHIDNTIEHYFNMIKLQEGQKDFSLMNQLYTTKAASLKNELNAIQQTKAALQGVLAKEQAGTKEWEATNAQINTMDEKIQKITEETLQNFQDQFNNSVNQIMDTLDKQISGGLGLEKLKQQWSDLKADQDKYLSTAEKIVAVGNLQFKVQSQINDSTNPMTKQKLQEYLDREMSTLAKKNKLTQYDVDRAQKLYDITEKQIALEEAQQNKSEQRLVRDSNGNWSYMYVQNTKEVEQAQQDLSSATQDLMSSDTKALQDNQDQMLTLKENFEKEVQDIVKKAQDGQYTSTAEFDQALLDAQNRFNTHSANLIKEGEEIKQNASESTLASVLNTYSENGEGLGVLTKDQETMLSQLGDNIGTEWDKIRNLLNDMNTGNAQSFKDKYADVVSGDATSMFYQLQGIYGDISSDWNNTVTKEILDNNNLQTSVAMSINNIIGSWNDYQTNVDRITLLTGEDLTTLGADTDALNVSIQNVTASTQAVIDKIKAEWEPVSNLINSYQSLNDQYATLYQNSILYVRQLEIQIAKQQQAAILAAAAAGGAPGPALAAIAAAGQAAIAAVASAPLPPVQTATPVVTKTLKVGGYAQVINSSAGAFMDSYGTSALPWTRQAAAIGDSYNSKMSVYGINNGYVALGNTNGGGAIAWVRMTDVAAMKTGGYTGDWNNDDGKLAMLHEKELVLNSSDTKNILDAVQIVRDYASMVRGVIGGTSVSVGNAGDQTIQQSVQINADFSGVKSHEEIERAFQNLANRASQYAFRKK